jgi:hypothetical protein
VNEWNLTKPILCPIAFHPQSTANVFISLAFEKRLAHPRELISINPAPYQSGSGNAKFVFTVAASAIRREPWDGPDAQARADSPRFPLPIASQTPAFAFFQAAAKAFRL